MLQITLKTKSVYGNDLIYPMCETSQKLANLINKKTFSNYDLKIIESLGYQITIL
jgi:hypothetical protein